MLTPSRALTLQSDSGTPLPRVDELSGLYNYGTVPRQGQVIMVVGRSGTQKSGFALWYANQLNLPTLYFSADMSRSTASKRIASTRSGLTGDEVDQILTTGGPERDRLMADLAESRIKFSFGAPITWRNVDQHLDAHVELFDAYPKFIVLDNLMDFENAESDYGEQMSVMQSVTQMARDTEATVMILHHATDKSFDAKTDPYNPPSRADVKGGMSEKAELTLGVALDPYSMDYKIATLKAREGPCDPTGRTFQSLRAEPELTRFHRKGVINYNRV